MMTDGSKNLSVAFIDIARSTELYDQLGDQVAKSIVSETIALIRARVQAAHGRVTRIIGDEALCIFPDFVACLDALREIGEGMQRDLLLSTHKVQLRIGAHHGPVIVDENDELYGDIVNVAARVQGIAREGEVLFPRDALGPEMDAFARFKMRSLGDQHAKGKKEPFEIMEFLWNPQPSALTMVSTLNKSLLEGGGPPSHIRLKNQAIDATFAVQSLPIVLGRCESSDFTVDNHHVSRKHAAIEFINDELLLRDQSTNGSRLQAEGTKMISVRRTHAHLHDKGLIILGKSRDGDDSNVIEYECIVSE